MLACQRVPGSFLSGRNVFDEKKVSLKWRQPFTGRKRAAANPEQRRPGHEVRMGSTLKTSVAISMLICK